MFKFFEVKIKGFKKQMQEVIEKLKDILASEGKREFK
ncbi:S24 family peptidase, partial [Campylobacter jejuni]|nr:S24 family peptidase [Campylobacter jejuni]